jgi:hypothetical protein
VQKNSELTFPRLPWRALPTRREQKYKATPMIDSFAARAGDVVPAGIVCLGKAATTSSVAQFAFGNVALVLGWVGAPATTSAQGRCCSAGRSRGE